MFYLGVFFVYKIYIDNIKCKYIKKGKVFKEEFKFVRKY